MNRHSFRYPLPQAALAEFVHPAPWHRFARYWRHDGEILAANGYVAIRAHRGAWLDREIPAASAEFLGRFGKLPWTHWEQVAGKRTWEKLDDESLRIWGHPRLGLWLNEKVAPSPVVCVNEVRVRLSVLQLVAMLPRAEVWAGPLDREHPLWFRFSGGRGCIARDAMLTARPIMHLFAPRHDVFDGTRLDKADPGRARGLDFSMKDWPPVEPHEPEPSFD